MKKKLIAVLLSSAMVCMATACGHTASGSADTSATKAAVSESSTTAGISASDTATASASGKTYHIGIIQQLEHPALDKATEGF